MPADTSAGARAWLPLLLVALVCSAGFAVLSDRFLTSFNIYVVLSSATLLALIGYSQLATLAVGDFSLAVGGIGEFTGIVLGYLLHTAGWPLLPAIVAAIAVALASGVLNGLIVVASGVSGFIVTLATGGAFAGAALAITETTPYTGLPAAFQLPRHRQGRAGAARHRDEPARGGTPRRPVQFAPDRPADACGRR